MSTVSNSSLFSPEVLARLVVGGFANVPIFYGTGVVAPDFTMPYGADYLGTAVKIPYTTLPNQWQVVADNSPLTPIAFAIGNAAGNSTTPETATVQRAGIALDMTTWAKSNPLDPYGVARTQMLLGFGQQMEQQLITAAVSSTGWSAYTVDVTAAADPLISHDAIVSATATMGAEAFNDSPIMLAVHSHTIGTMWNRKNALGMPWLVAYAGEMSSTGAKIYRLEPFGIPVYVSDYMPVSTGTGPGGADVYTSAVLRRNSLALYVNPNLSARSVQEPLTDAQLDALNCYFAVHRYLRLNGRAKPGVALIKHL